MGEVYRARDTKLNREVALKVLPAAMANDAERMARFQREAQVLASLNHPNIAAIYGLEESGGVRALVMELVEGPTLAERIAVTPPSRRPSEGGRMPALQIDESLHIAKQIAEGLEYAHERGVIHRDLKPANIKVRPDGTVKVLDFGLAKAAEPQDSAANVQDSPTLSIAATQAGVILGTAAYMSPEQARGKPVDKRADIWAFGVVLYEMFTGQRLFGGETVSDTLAAVITKEPDWEVLPASTPARIRQLLRRCLTRDPKQRLQAIGEARIAIEEVQSGDVGADSRVRPEAGAFVSRPTPLQPAGAADTSSDRALAVTLARRHMRALLGGAAALLALLAAAGYAVYRLRGSAGQGIAPSSAPANMQITQLTTSGTAGPAAISPDGRYVAYVQAGASGKSLWLRQIATGSDVRIIPPAGVFYKSLTFSPDGNYIDYVMEPQNGAEADGLYQVPALGGQSSKLLAADVITAIAFSPSTKRLACGRCDLQNGECQIVLVSADGSGEQILASSKLAKLLSLRSRLAWSPDGKVIAMNAGTSSQQFYPTAIDISSGREQEIGSRRWTSLGEFTWLPDGKSLLVVATDFSTPSQNQLWRVSYPDGQVSRITNDLNDYENVSVTADGKALATVTTKATSNIWVAAKGDWSRLQQLTRGLGDADGINGLSWTEGGKIVYTSAANGNSSLLLVNPQNDEAQKLVQRSEFSGEPSACGGAGYITFSAASQGGGPYIWRVDADGGGLKQLTSGENERAPSCAPDGKSVVYHSNFSGKDSFWRVSVEGGKPVQLTRAGFLGFPFLSPDGKWIVSEHMENPQRPLELAIFPSAGGEPVKTFQIPSSFDPFVPLAWTPDGRAIAYLIRVEGVSNIMAQPLDGSPARQVTHYDSGRVFRFAWSRDGQLALARGTESRDVVLIKGFQ